MNRVINRLENYTGPKCSTCCGRQFSYSLGTNKQSLSVVMRRCKQCKRQIHFKVLKLRGWCHHALRYRMRGKTLYTQCFSAHNPNINCWSSGRTTFL